MQIVLEALSPIMHGAFGESAGNATLIRRMPLVGLPGKPRVPVISGNALRGIMRRIVMRDLLKRCGASRETLDAPTWDRLYAALANGGHLEASETRIDPQRIRDLRAALPPVSVFGAALYSWLLPGHVDIGIGWPVCTETIAAGLVPAAEGAIPAEELVHEVSHCRHVDREHQDPEVSGVTPMPTTVEAIGTGARLVSRIDFAAHATELERSVISWAAERISSIGGKSSAGLGSVRVSIADGVPSQLYQDWLDNVPSRDHLAPWLDVLSGAKARKGKAAPAEASQ